MKGVHHITVTSKGLTYNIVLERKITIIKGKSATGKSTLVGMISDWLTSTRHSGTGVSVKFDANKIYVIDGRMSIDDTLYGKTNCIFVADEGKVDLDDYHTCDLINCSDNYFLFVSRLGCIAGLTYAISSIVELKTEKHGNVFYTSAYRKYIDKETSVKPDLLITEDKKSGYEMMKAISKFEVTSGEGKNNVVHKVKSAIQTYSSVAIFVDGAAFGSCIGMYGSLLKRVTIVAPESFEFVLLNLNFIRRYCKEELEHTEQFCDFNSEIISYERYYTDLLTRILKERFGVSYTKSRLPALFKNEQVYEQVKAFLSDIDFT